jgi:hypothetical protein
VGEEAHIVAREPGGPRGGAGPGGDEYSNLVLLCPTHHRIVDDRPDEYTVERLLEFKSEHEARVAELGSPDDRSRQVDDERYAMYVDDWARRVPLAFRRLLIVSLTSRGSIA